MPNPFVEFMGLAFDEQRAGYSRFSVEIAEDHFNSHGVVHGAVAYALADTGMGAALKPTMAEGQICATIEIKMNYFKPVASGRMVCVTELVNRGKKIANLDSRVYLGETLVASANGSYAIFTPGRIPVAGD
jgi:acyl-CoA thioesterase